MHMNWLHHAVPAFRQPHARVALLNGKRMVQGVSYHLMPLRRYSSARSGVFLGTCRQQTDMQCIECI